MKCRIDLKQFPQLQPYTHDDLVRVGSDNDGGYVISRYALDNSDALLSFGNGFNIDFEFHFLKMRKWSIHVHCYDGTTEVFSLAQFLKSIQSSIKFKSFIPISRHLVFLYKSIFLISNGSRFLKQNLSKSPSTHTTTLYEALKRSMLNNNLFLKIDIEGEEWNHLNLILETSDVYQGLVVEFHSISKNNEILQDFLKQIKDKGFNLDHIHANNYSGISENGLPETIEFSISKIASAKSYSKYKCLPISHLDMPCSPVRPEIEIYFVP